LVDQVLFITDIARQQIGHEHIGKSVFPMKRVHHRPLLDPQKLAICHGCRGSHTESLPCQRAFPKKISLILYSDRGFLANLGYDSKLYLAFLDIKDGVSRITLREDPLLLGNGQALPALADGGEECVGELAAVLGNST
jgi:hypothetical protein